MIIRALLLSACLLVACEREQYKPELKESTQSHTSYSVASQGWAGALITVRHDKHLFIVEARTGKGAVIHHPDCPCGKAR